MRVAVEVEEPEVSEVLSLSLPAFLLDADVISASDATTDVVVTDTLDHAAGYLARGLFVVHYCFAHSCGSEQHVKSLRDHPRFRVVLNEDGGGGPILVQVLEDIERHL